MKDKSIIEAVQYLQNKFGEEKVIIEDHWDGDMCAIGLTGPTKTNLVYISTYKISAGLFFVSIELPSKDINFPYIDGGSFENITLLELEEIVKKYLILL